MSGQSVVIRDEELPTLLFNAAGQFAKKHYVLSGSWVLGILVCLFATGFAPDSQSLQQYQETLGTLDHAGLMAAENSMWRWEGEYRRSKGWFFSCDKVCQENWEMYRMAETEYYAEKARYEQTISEAKKAVGLTSNMAEEETRNLFWDMFSRGQGFAKRTTMWDALFLGIGAMGRDEHLLSYLLRLAIQMLFNFTLGLFGALVGFWWSLWGLISSYQPDPLTGLLFFAVAGLAAWSFVMTWLLGLYMGTAGAVYVVAKTAINAQRIEGGQQYRQGYVQYNQHPRAGNMYGGNRGRPHYE